MDIRKFIPRSSARGAWILFFLLTWLWASWWMGDSFRIAREQSFFAFDATLMRGLWQQPFGFLWIIGRAILVLYRWPLLGGLVVALMLTGGTWLIAYCLRLRPDSRWHPLCYIPAIAWMAWVAWIGLNIYFQAESGRPFGILFLVVLICAIDAFVIWTFKKRGTHPAPSHQEVSGKWMWSWAVILLLLYLLPFAITHQRHPYQRPFTRMQVQLLHDDWQGIIQTAHDNAELSYRPLAADYAIALIHTGRLADDLFDIRLDYDTLFVKGYGNYPNVGTGLYQIDCDYHAGLFRTATHHAVEHLTMMGPTLFSLKHLTRLALLDYDWPLARKYLLILKQAPFEGDFVARYEPMVGHPELVDADPIFAQLRLTEPVNDAFEGQFEEPSFLGYTATMMVGRSKEALMQSLMACLYSKRMPDFLMRCQPLVGATLPRSVAEGLVTQVSKEPDILKVFPQLNMNAQMFQNFIRTNQFAFKDRPTYARKLFNTYKGYYPYYYFFGNLKATRKRSDEEHGGSKAGVN